MTWGCRSAEQTRDRNEDDEDEDEDEDEQPALIQFVRKVIGNNVLALFVYPRTVVLFRKRSYTRSLRCLEYKQTIQTSCSFLLFLSSISFSPPRLFLWQYFEELINRDLAIFRYTKFFQELVKLCVSDFLTCKVQSKRK